MYQVRVRRVCYDLFYIRDQIFPVKPVTNNWLLVYQKILADVCSKIDVCYILFVAVNLISTNETQSR